MSQPIFLKFLKVRLFKSKLFAGLPRKKKVGYLHASTQMRWQLHEYICVRVPLCVHVCCVHEDNTKPSLQSLLLSLLLLLCCCCCCCCCYLLKVYQKECIIHMRLLHKHYRSVLCRTHTHTHSKCVLAAHEQPPYAHIQTCTYDDTKGNEWQKERWKLIRFCFFSNPPCCSNNNKRQKVSF